MPDSRRCAPHRRLCTCSFELDTLSGTQFNAYLAKSRYIGSAHIDDDDDDETRFVSHKQRVLKVISLIIQLNVTKRFIIGNAICRIPAMKLKDVEFAPLCVPLSRRLETLAAAAWIYLVVFGGMTGWAVLLYILMATRFWWAALMYGLWIYLDRSVASDNPER